MRLTDMFILRPVLSVVVSVFILLLGLGSERVLPVRQFPKTVNALIQVETTYYGADAATMAGFITTPIENAIAQVDGIDYLTSTSIDRRQHDHRASAAESGSGPRAYGNTDAAQRGARPAAA